MSRTCCVHAAAGGGYLVPHRLPAVAHIDRAAVGKARSVRRIESAHRKQFAEIAAAITACSTDGIRDEVRHGEHRGPGLEGESVKVQYPSPAACQLFVLHDCDVAPAAIQLNWPAPGTRAGGRAAAQPHEVAGD
jgi:hypothetical protein